jgi:hypothetical protein
MVLAKTSLLRFSQRIQYLLVGLISLLCAVPAVADQEAAWRYTVRPGDNLITLGKMHLINPDDWKTLQQLNHIENPHRIPAGKVLRIPLSLVKQGPASAEIIFVSGQAQWQQSATDFKPLAVGDKLNAGAHIVTKENSKVVIKFADGTTTELSSNSILVLDSMSLYSGGTMVDTKLRLQKGRLETHANPQQVEGNGLQVITPSAIAAVRGTKFRVTADQKATTQETLDGQVALGSSNQAVIVSKGYGSLAERGKPPIPPVSLLPAVNATGFKTQFNALPLTFNMPDMQGAVAWSAKVATDAKFNRLVAEVEAKGNQLVFADLPDGQLHLNLRAKDKQGIAGYETVHAFVLNARPFQPEIVSPALNSVVRENRPVLQWQKIADADLYAVEVATDATFKKIVESIRVEGLVYQLNKKLEEGQYFWRVISIAKLENGQEDVGPALEVSQFRFKPVPSKPDISDLHVTVSRNRVYVQTKSAPAGLSYAASLDNEFNHQKEVWRGSGLSNEFDFLLKEYGKQTLYIQHVDSDGVVGPAAVYEFYATPQ